MIYLAFFCACFHTEFDYLETRLKEYDIGNYIIAAETAVTGVHPSTDGQHFHFMVEMETDTYHRFSKSVFTDKYKLQGRARNGVGRQYGKVTQIENIEKMKQYTVKNNNLRTSLSPEEIATLIEKSFIKEEKKSIENELMEYLGELKLRKWVVLIDHRIHESFDLCQLNCGLNYTSLTKGVIQFYLDKTMRVPPPALIKSYIKHFCSQLSLDMDNKCKLLMQLMDIRNPFVQTY